MKLMMPLLLAAPTLLQGTLAVRGRRRLSAPERRRIKIGIIFNVCYLAAVSVVALMLSYV
jgi:hypothetical protein